MEQKQSTMEGLEVNMLSTLPRAEFWQGKNVLLTGHTGFKGSWLWYWLELLGANVSGLALEPNTQPSLFHLLNPQPHPSQHHIVDIQDAKRTAAVIKAVNPEIILHLAAQPLVRLSYQDPLGTFNTNVMGTANVLEAARSCANLKAIVAITTDKVYENKEWVHPYRESDPLGGYDPYSASKAACEIVISSYRRSFFLDKGVQLVSARAGNVIGGGDWSVDRIIPDAVRAWSTGQALSVRRPAAIRPWQHVIEPLCGYLLLAEKAYANQNHQMEAAWNFGPNTHEAGSVRQVIELAQKAFGTGDVIWGDGHEGPHEAGLLLLDASLSRTYLKQQAVFSLSQTVSMTLDWYRDWIAGANAQDLCQRDLLAYQTACQND